MRSPTNREGELINRQKQKERNDHHFSRTVTSRSPNCPKSFDAGAASEPSAGSLTPVLDSKAWYRSPCKRLFSSISESKSRLLGQSHSDRCISWTSRLVVAYDRLGPVRQTSVVSSGTVARGQKPSVHSAMT